MMVPFARMLLMLGFCLLAQRSMAQTDTLIRWWNPMKGSFSAIEGQAWPTEVGQPFSRLPERAKKTVTEAVWNLSKNSTGLIVRFKTNAAQITIRYVVEAPIAFPHMPATGVSGIDLYGVKNDGSYLWCAGKYSFKDTIQFRFTDLKPLEHDTISGIEYRLHLPLYNTVKWLEIGVPKEKTFVPLKVREKKPIVVYGTSIAQGACASRPGMAWTAILSRKTNTPLINLGFSGTGRLDESVISLINELDAGVFILDCLPNLTGFKEDDIYNRITSAVKNIRTSHPKTPIVLTDHFGYTDAPINPVKRAAYLKINTINHKAFADLKSQGIRHISILSKKELGQDMDTMVDGTHPTDLGMLRYANAYYKHLNEIGWK
ncbi:MAG: SGNH/GDSL hydrolase family protein [Chitinophagaceae bacterium]